MNKKMKVLVVGSGGREHAIAWALSRSDRVSQIYNASMNAGLRKLSRQVDCNPADINSLVRFASEERIDLTFVGPEQPLVDGIVDLFKSRGFRIFGPDATTARLEGSKVAAKQFMQRYGVPTSRYAVTETPAEAQAVIDSELLGFPVVIKADGLAAGKGVVIAADKTEANDAIEDLMVRKVVGEAGSRLVIEECLSGRELSYLIFSDGRNYSSLPVAQDHKRAFDGDKGPNTGGMGAFTTPGLLDNATEQRIRSEIVEPSLEGCVAEGTPFRGVLYFGLMLTADGPRVLEYNVRLGDPETQALIRRLRTDIADVCDAVIEGNLDRTRIEWSDESATAIVMASRGYPGPCETGKEITGVDLAEQIPEVVVFHSGTRRGSNEVLETAGGRVLAVTSIAADLHQATGRAYEAAGRIRFEGMHFRRDIGV